MRGQRKHEHRKKNALQLSAFKKTKNCEKL